MNQTNNKKPIYLKDYQPSPFVVDDLALQFELDCTKTLVINTMQIHRSSQTSQNIPLKLDGEKIQLQSIALNGRPLAVSEYEVSDQALIIFNTPERFSLQIETCCNPKANTALDGLYISNDIFCTQCEPHGFRKITYYLDRPDVMTKFTTTIIADAKRYPVLLSNGNCISEEMLEDGRKKVVWQDPFNKPCYLFALVAGKLFCHEDFFITCSGRKVTLRIFVETGNETKTQHAMEMLKKAMRWDEEKYGREYDLNIFMIVAVSDFNMGAMENKGLNIFNAKFILANAETATDADYEGIAGVVAHEYFHNWTGNRITCRDWFQLSLKEGLTVFRDQEFTGDITSKPMTRIEDVRFLVTAQFAEDAGPLAHPVRPASYIEMNNFYTMTVYHKGAEVIRMLHTLEGEVGYRKGMDLYFERFDGMAVTCDDFVQAHADANQKDYRQFMRWYDQAGTPCLKFSDEFDAKAKKYFLTVEQHIPSTADGSPKAPLMIPICFALYTDKLLEKGVVVLEEVKQTFEFDNILHKPVPSLMQNFSAPVKWKYPYTLAERLFLLKHDIDHFNRFEMAQQIFYDLLSHQRKAGFKEDLKAYLEALDQVLQGDAIDPAMRAKLLTFPSYREIAEQQEIIQVKKIISERKTLVQEAVGYLAETAYRVLKNLPEHQIYTFNAKAGGERSLKAICLQVLLQAKHPQALAFLEKMYEQANNMTNRYNALYALMLFGDSEKDAKTFNDLLQDFYRRYKNDALVMEKYLSLQAIVPHEDTLLLIKKLMKTAEFDFKNPNKVRALIGTFTAQNFVGFHCVKDGAGYEFLAEQVLALDAINPTIAARIVEPLTQWKRYEDAHAVLMRSSLQYIYVHKLSTNLRELVEKSIG